MMLIAHLIERIYQLLAPYGMKVPQLTPSRITLLSCHRTFSSFKASDRLGYRPIVPLQEGLKRTIESYSDLSAEAFLRRKGPSKASVYLGGGMVSDIFLWKDIKQTLSAMLVLVSFYVNFVLPGDTMITAISKVFIIASVFLFIHGKFPDKWMGFSIDKIAESNFQYTDSMARQIALSVVSSWNCAADSFRSISRGSDSMLFLKTALSLSIIALIGSLSLQTFFSKVLPLAFIALYMYEQKEDEINGFLLKFLPIGCLSNPYNSMKKHE